MKIPSPFIPLRAETKNLEHVVHVIGRDYTIGADGMLTSIKSEGQELLAGPVRMVLMEDGGPALWDENYPENESESFIQQRSDEQIVICGAKQSERFIVDTCSTIGYDGCIDMDVKLMTRGKTVAQCYGTAEIKPLEYKLDQLWLEIPLKAEAMTLYHMTPKSVIELEDGTSLPLNDMCSSGRIPDQSVQIPFKAFLWLGNEERGFGWFAENDRNWQPAKETCAMEIVRHGEELVLRVHLLDGHPVSWKADYSEGAVAYLPISFHFGFQVTPVKPFPKQPYIHNAFHLDCGIKIKGNYMDFLSAENRFDRLAQMGVTTLILHEKWNKAQNWFELSEYTGHQLRYIVDECHKRNIKVLPYFGYELSVMSPIWSEQCETFTGRDINGNIRGGWWRVPFQREYVTCYNSGYADLFVKGIADMMDMYQVDGVYLDGTAHAPYCCSVAHGCGWYDENGRLRGTYPIRAVRRLFQRLYEVVQSRGGQINVHMAGIVNFTAIPYIHQNWYGEILQLNLIKGSTADMNLDFFRAEYTGRNMGAPVEFIAYENRPIWCFEHAVAYSILHGILPRPNDIGYPLELMSCIWRILDAFPIEKSEWLPYWNNEVKTSHEKVRVSYYRYTGLDKRQQILAFAVNISADPVEQVTVTFQEAVSGATDMERKEEMERNEETGFSFGLEKYGYRILFVHD